MNQQPVAGILALSVLGAAALAGCQRSGSEGTTASAPAGSTASAAASGAGRGGTAVSVFAAQKRDVPVTVEAAGTVVALDAVDVRPQLSGTIAEVLVKDGDFVRRGQPLFRLDVRAQQANADRARAQLLKDQATLADLERQWKRAQELRTENFIAQSAADTVRASLDAQRATVAASQAALRAAEVDLSFGTISAPLAGRIGAVAVHRGSLVQPGGTALVGIKQIDPIGVSFSVPESQLAALLRTPGGSAQDTGTEVAVSAPGMPADRGRGAAPAAAPLRGKVVFVDNAVDTPTGTIKVKAELANPAQALWPGQYVNVHLTTRTMAGALVIPQAALVIRGNDRSVYVVKADSTVESRPVQSRMPIGEFVVVEGLQEGERVVVEGKQNVRPGSSVRPTPWQSGTDRRGGGKGAGGAGGAGGAAGVVAGTASGASAGAARGSGMPAS